MFDLTDMKQRLEVHWQAVFSSLAGAAFDVHPHPQALRGLRGDGHGLDPVRRTDRSERRAGVGRLVDGGDRFQPPLIELHSLKAAASNSL